MPNQGLDADRPYITSRRSQCTLSNGAQPRQEALDWAIQKLFQAKA